MSLTVVTLTYNEEMHIARALGSAREIADRMIVVDCGSTDETVKIAIDCGAEILNNHWINYATQFNWALDQLPESTQWVFRLDADEVVTPELAAEIDSRLHTLGKDIDGIFVSRRMTFLRRPIRYGGIFPIRVLRIFRHGRGRCENRWMDEHIKVPGKTADLWAEIIDDNLNSLTWWTEKHNSYASREVVDLLNLQYGFMPHETIANIRSTRQADVKRWFKENVYARLPSGFRAFAYFFYRYVLRFGFLDGSEGAAFHVLQGFWYRFLVDAKLYEVRKYMRENDIDIVKAIEQVLGIRVR